MPQAGRPAFPAPIPGARGGDADPARPRAVAERTWRRTAWTGSGRALCGAAPGEALPPVGSRSVSPRG